MVTQFQNIREAGLGGGIDTESAENQIPEGFVEDAVNVDANSEGYLTKRPGYEGFSGTLPFRVQSYQQLASTNKICFTLDSSVNLSKVRNTPLVVQGKLSTAPGTGDFGLTDSVQYYAQSTTDIRYTLSGTGSISIPATDHVQGTPFLFMGLAQSTSTTNFSNSTIFPEDVSINQATQEVTISYVNGTDDFQAFVYWLGRDTLLGDSWQGSSNGEDTTVTVPLDPNNDFFFTIPASMHNLKNNQIGVKLFVDTAGLLIEVLPESVVIAPSGDVTIGFRNQTLAPGELRAVLTSVPDDNFVVESLPTGQTSVVTIPNVGTEFNFVYTYFENLSTGNWEMVFPESVVYDDVAEELQVTFINNTGAAANFYVFHETANISINEICVDANTPGITDLLDESPQLTLWGLEHDGSYAAGAGNRAGWVQHVDSYRAPGVQFLVSGLGGNLFEAGTKEDYSATHLLPTLYPRLTERVTANTLIAPAFTGTTDTQSRSRGVLAADGGEEGYLVGHSVTAEVGGARDGLIKYSFSLTNDSLVDAVSILDVISTTTGDEDWLTVEQTCFSRNAGTFKIRDVSYVNGSGVLEIWVENPAYSGLPINTAPDYDETGSAFRAAIFTDRLEMQAPSRFIRGDQLSLGGAGLGSGSTFVVTGTTGAFVRFSGVTDAFNVASGLRVLATRSGRIIPLRTASGVASVEGLLRGDVCALSGRASKLRILDVNTFADQTVAIDGDLVTGVDTSNLRVGDYVLLAQAGDYDGEFQVTGIVSETSCLLDASSRGLDAVVPSCIIVGKTAVTDDESLSFTDSTINAITLSVPQRWIPLESPTPSSADYGQVKQTYTQHLDSAGYSAQSPLRSVMVQDSLYFTNGEDEVLKYEGLNLTRAGLPRFQLLQFLQVTATSGGGILVPDFSVSGTVTAGSIKVEVTPAKDVSGFNVGDIVNVASQGRFTVADRDLTNGHLYLDKAVTAHDTGSISKLFTYRYYARLKLIDANNATVVSATAGAEDFSVLVGNGSTVTLRLLQPPAFESYNYERMEVELFRTKANGNTYYRLLSRPLTFREDAPYVDFVDNVDDSLLVELDAETSNFKGSRLGPTLQAPFRSKHITSVNNRLVLANVKSYPTLNLVLGASALEVTPAVMNNKVMRLISADPSVPVADFRWQTSGLVSATATVTPGVKVSVDTGGPAHNLQVGYWVYLTSATSTTFSTAAGWYKVSQVTSASVFEVENTAADASANGAIRFLAGVSATSTPVYLGTDDGNFGYRFGNDSTFARQLVINRTVAAINAWARSLGKDAWLVAQGGGEFEGGEIVLQQSSASGGGFSVLMPQTSDFRVFANGLALTVSSATEADRTAFSRVYLYPSRLVASYSNYPEVFDFQQSATDAFSDSAVDVNSADGQEITGIIPFFGDAAFGAAQKSDILVVFKTNSIYLVDLSIKAQGGEAVRKIESNGLGCTAPYSIAATRQGIMFANESGIYRLTRNLTVEYVGRKIERRWSGRESSVDLTQSDLMMGHNWSAGRYYRLSYPTKGAKRNDGVFAYNHSREYSPQSGGVGSWMIYDNHPATGWANLGEEAYFASTKGRVFKLRSAGDNTDFRDDDQAIEAEVTLRALDFGSAAVRKLVRSILLHLRTPRDVTATQLLAAVDMSNDFRELDAFQVDVADTPDGLSDVGRKRVVTIKFSTYQSKFNHIQLKIRNLAKDEGMEVTHVAFRVAGLSDAGLTQAARTTGQNG